MRAQAPLLAAAARIEQFTAQDQLDGLGGTALQADKLTVYWHGTVPTELTTVLDQLRRTVPIEIRPAQHSRRELDPVARQMSLDPQVDSAGVLSDAAGLWVSYRQGAKPRVAAAAAPDQVSGDRPAVTVLPPGDSRPVASRLDDAPPFLAGGAITNGKSTCTTGFAARSTKDGKEYMTLSNHCGANADWHYPEGAKRPAGHTGSGQASIDANLLSSTNGGTSNYAAGVYIGSPNDYAHVPVNGLAYPAVGAQVCYSGALSGLTCSSTITQDRAFVNGIGPGFWAEQQDHQAAIGNGDSGGPTLAASTGNGANGIGINTIIDGTKEVPCQGIVATNRRCSWRAFSTNLSSVLTNLGLTLKTTS